ncbi:MAG TPA: methyltransferase domain-containing protein [Terriglobales bacterium]|nr:methyltransferase domain-containing protein [Terriglobales bacterium]
MAREARLYDRKFYRELEETRDSARELLPIVLDLLKPASIVDIGCGAGHWLAVAAELGVTGVLGIDGDWVLKTQLAIPRDKFLVHDLQTPLKLERKFDLALSLEVAEHLPESQAREFVRTLCGAADCVLFSAAIPGQGGRHHVNEQWPAYWAALFAGFGFDCYDVLRPRIWTNPRVLWYYAQNCLIFARAGAAPGLGVPAQPLPLVHPTLWSAQIKRMNSPAKLLEQLPKALKKLM